MVGKSEIESGSEGESESYHEGEGEGESKEGESEGGEGGGFVCSAITDLKRTVWSRVPDHRTSTVLDGNPVSVDIDIDIDQTCSLLDVRYPMLVLIDTVPSCRVNEHMAFDQQDKLCSYSWSQGSVCQRQFSSSCAVFHRIRIV